MDEAVTTTLQYGLPRDIVMNNIPPFLALPSHTFEEVEGEESEDEEGDSGDEEMEVGVL